ncbi:protein up-regulated by thyroid hormone-PQQ-dependent glucose dehydrogenase [Adhaeribacter aerolatus]|uniref:Protein up-regulated by thyroid hormone-PQQ-dependent glucose dehydrogenase n=1 Tax=Adhaeribacter aerolatus TaxID=670289 RepID=A0A512ATA4_9BACT|nr:PQQ-dependent sugar dehydrogenase [Adhaeribacter aerolatus]GEO02928.1 protein up-regulated by thyroid hormone-PQQ-dependent glucose dehydrogenase [Adhaeribacter aerolatus]
MKMPFIISLLNLVLLLAGCDLSDSQQDSNNGNTPPGKYELVAAFPNLTVEQPVELTSPNDGTDRIFVVAQKGKIHVFQNKSDVNSAPVFLDISNRVVEGGERGLLGLAFHPDYKSNGYFYVNYTGGSPLQTFISRFKVSAGNPNQADPGSEEILLRFNQPYANHNGGKVTFGNDGYLYIAVGDGGSGGDPQNYAQNRKELLGKVLRIDVNKTEGNQKYAIPNDNPFKGNTEGNRPEIFAYGLRNPWRMNFDRVTGTLWAGDVGQNKIEEVSIIQKGGNYGWKIMEGDACFEAQNCDKTNLQEPIYAYQQGSDTGRSITGGYVVRDKNLPGLEGKYIYGDFVTGNIWALTFANNKAVKNELVTKLDNGLSSFGEDSKNGIYVLAYGSGKIYKFSPVQE